MKSDGVFSPDPNDRESTIDFPTTDRVGSYRLDGKLGHGRFGTVYRGCQASKPAVALKVLHQPISGPEEADRFHRRARKLQTLDHPHLVRVHEADIGPVPSVG